RHYRLPNAEEAEKLYGKPSAEANTLDYWAGYPPNPEDTEGLHRAIHQLDSRALLLRAVGTSDSVGENGNAVYDLGGNVAEWATDSDGKPVLRGGAANMPANPKDDSLTTCPHFRGLRVVLEK
ncbi:MAG TPA: peptidase S9, partial [Acidobacteriota bacterium]|nr:peptidase S9 [Acidobacteriota bacterium]